METFEARQIADRGFPFDSLSVSGKARLTAVGVQAGRTKSAGVGLDDEYADGLFSAR
jgi:hypothetical protein